MRKALFILFVLISSKAAFSQCSGVTITPNKANYCAGEPVKISVNNPKPLTNYRIVIDGVTYADTIATVGFSGAATTTDHFIDVQYNVLGNWISCVLFPPSRPKVTVSPSPDPTIKDISANQSGTGFKQCITAPTYKFDIQNASSTAGTYTQTYTINWGDGSAQVGPTANFTTLSHTYTSPGGYTLTYTVTANELSGACKTVTKTYDLYFGVLPNIGGIGSLGNFILCAPKAQQYLIDTSITNRNPPGTTYTLSVGGVNAMSFVQPIPRELPPYNFTANSCEESCGGDNYFLVKITAKNLCGELSSSTCQPVAEEVKPIIEGRDTVCVGVPTSFRNTDLKSRTFVNGNCQPAFHTWRIIPATGYSNVAPALNIPVQNNGLNVTFNQTGTYRITVRDSGYCNVRDTFKDIIVVDRVRAQAAYTAPSCIPATGFVDIPMTNTSGAVSDIIKYTWSVLPATGISFSVGNENSVTPTIRFTKSGNYTIRLDIEGGCNTASWDSTIIIKGKPAIDTLKIPEGCFAPYIINPRDYFNYTNGGDPNAMYSWVFSGGVPSTSSIENPGNITFNGPGTFAISLNIRAQCGDSTLTNFVMVNNNVKPNAGPDRNVCKFSAPITLSAVPAGGVWRGDGITDSVAGIFNSSSITTSTVNIVYVLNPTGNCPTLDTVKINVIEIVGLTAGPDQTICKGSGMLKLIGDTAFPNGTWFGTGVVNGTTGIFDPTGIVPGNYQIGYIFGDASGACSDTAYKKVTVFDSVHVSLPPPVLCFNQPFNFGNISGNLSAARWNFGDGTPDAFIVNPSHVFTRTGNFTVTLYAETPDRCLDTIVIPVTVISNPPLRFIVNPDSSCTGNNITFSFPAGHDTATNYIWDFGSSTVQTTIPTTQTFSFPKPILRDTLYFVTLRADYYCGPSFFTDTVKVKASPKADFGIQNIGCSPFTPALANTSYGSPTSFVWDFGNGNTTTFESPIPPTYINTTRRDTSYKIKLSVLNTCGSDTITKSITVKGNDIFAKYFTDITQGCQPLEVNFFNLSSPGADIIWDFGDGTSAFADNIPHVYDSAGTYRAKIYARGSCGIDSFTTTITVFGKPKPAFTYTPACAGLQTQFINNTTNGNSYIWYFGDGDSSISTRPNPTHVYAATGAYTVKLIVANARPCVDSISVNIRVSTKPTAAFTVPVPKVCEQEPISFINNSTDALNYIWYFGNGETSTAASLSYTYPTSGLYDVTLTAINGDCKDSVTQLAAVEIYPKPVAGFLYEFTGNGFNAPIEFTNTTFNGNTFFWKFGDGDTSDVKDPGSHQYNGEGPYRVTLYTESTKGCKDTVSIPLGVDYTGQLYVPNVFSPEVGIGESAIFKPKGLALKEYRLEIFSTYGQLLFETTALENGQPVEGWDGRWKGTILPQDVYVWKIRAIFTDGKAWPGMKDPKTGKRAVMGSVILLR